MYLLVVQYGFTFCPKEVAKPRNVKGLYTEWCLYAKQFSFLPNRLFCLGALIMAKEWPFSPLVPLSYGLVMADPPWSFDNWSVGGNKKTAKAQYACMETEDIAALPVGYLAGGDCWLWLWATHPMLDVGMAVLKAWGFRFVTSGEWVKRGISGKLAMGTGYILRTASEPFLLGKIGDPKTFSRSERSAIEAPRRQHSRKPDNAYKMAERLFGPVRRADLFSRQSRPGWETWGHGAGYFDVDRPKALPTTIADLSPGPIVDAPLPLFDWGQPTAA